MPAERARERVDQWVASFGASSKVLHNHPFHVLIADVARSPGSWLVMQAVQAPLGKAPPPLAHRGRVQGELGSDFPVGVPLGGKEHDPTPLGKCLGALRPARPALKRLALGGAQQNVRRWPAQSSHGSSIVAFHDRIRHEHYFA